MDRRNLLILSLFCSFLANCHQQKYHDNPPLPCFDCFDFRLTDYEPAWSPNGKYIAYIHGDTSLVKTGIYLIVPDGSGNRLWSQGVGTQEPSWSPDGQWLAFSDGGQLWKKKVNGDSLTSLTTEGLCFSPSWSPDGQWIAFRRSYSYPEKEIVQGIWKVKMDGKDKTQLFSGNSGEPIWTSVNSIVFIRGVTTSNGNVIGDSLLLISLPQNTISGQFLIEGDNVYLKYSAKNSKIVFSSKPQNNVSQICTMNADGTNFKQLTHTQGYSCDWSSDGEKIVYTDSRAINGRLWIMNADGTGSSQLTFANQF